MTTYVDGKDAPPVRKQSQAKLLIKTGIFLIFGTLFGLALYHDLTAGVFHFTWALLAFVPCLGIGYSLSRLVPMQVYRDLGIITMSFDRIYFAIILVLVAVKAAGGKLLHIPMLADIIMCIILGLMVSRIGGIGLRVHSLKKSCQRSSQC